MQIATKTVKHLRKITKIAPSDPTPHYRMSVIYRKLGRTAEDQQARQMFQKLKAAQPADK